MTISPAELNFCPSATPPSESWLSSDFISHQTNALYSERAKREEKENNPSILPPFSHTLSRPAIAAVTWPNKVSQEKGSGMTEGERRGWGLPIFSPPYSVIPPSTFWIPQTISHTTHPLPVNGLYLLNPPLPPFRPSSDMVYFSLTLNTATTTGNRKWKINEEYRKTVKECKTERGRTDGGEE